MLYITIGVSHNKYSAPFVNNLFLLILDKKLVEIERRTMKVDGMPNTIASSSHEIGDVTLLIPQVQTLTAMLVLIGLIFGVYRFLVMRNGDIIGI
jgi:hypothetical protein